VKILIGFHNKGELNFIVDNIDASLRYNSTTLFFSSSLSLISIIMNRYPQDFSYFIQNVRNTMVQFVPKLISIA
jgi:hypothetical protein